MWCVAVTVASLGVGTSLMMMRAVYLPNLSTVAPTMSASARTMNQIDSLAPALRHVGAKIMVTP
jgi:hypothetical protein